MGTILILLIVFYIYFHPRIDKLNNGQYIIWYNVYEKTDVNTYKVKRNYIILF